MTQEGQQLPQGWTPQQLYTGHIEKWCQREGSRGFGFISYKTRVEGQHSLYLREAYITRQSLHGETGCVPEGRLPTCGQQVSFRLEASRPGLRLPVAMDVTNTNGGPVDTVASRTFSPAARTRAYSRYGSAVLPKTPLFHAHGKIMFVPTKHRGKNAKRSPHLQKLLQQQAEGEARIHMAQRRLLHRRLDTEMEDGYSVQQWEAAAECAALGESTAAALPADAASKHAADSVSADKAGGLDVVLAQAFDASRKAAEEANISRLEAEERVAAAAARAADAALAHERSRSEAQAARYQAVLQEMEGFSMIE